MILDGLEPEDRAWAEEAARKFTAEECAHYGIEPSDPAKVWWLLDPAGRIDCRSVEGWLEFLVQPECRDAAIEEVRGDRVSLVAYGPDARTAVFRAKLHTVYDKADKVYEALLDYPTRKPSQQKRIVARCARTLMFNGNEGVAFRNWLRELKEKSNG